ncbi:hypothetical protein B0H14DRAFT_3538816 [Mycena olivaceomarginata]|nr:hypothetical protein B0H14DRAFT_3538816 [Mycena olivaceomarginata]
MSTCTGLAALDHANTKYSQGYATTGLRDGDLLAATRLFAKTASGISKRGEIRNMDYIVASAWRHLRDLLFFLLSYDIMCQWVKNLRERLLKSPAHRAAQADMEGIERIWSIQRVDGASTREMGPGSPPGHNWRRFLALLDWNKVVGMARHSVDGCSGPGKNSHGKRRALEEFTAHCSAGSGSSGMGRKAVDEYETGVSSVTQTSYLTTERERSAPTALDAENDTMIHYLMLGLEIEGQQSGGLRLLQRVYSPGALQHLATAEDPVEPAESERAPLLLPLGLLPAQAAPPLSVSGLAAAEARLRDGQCGKSLEAIRHGLIVKRRLQTYKTLNLPPPAPEPTRSRTLVDRAWRSLQLAGGVQLVMRSRKSDLRSLRMRKSEEEEAAGNEGEAERGGAGEQERGGARGSRHGRKEPPRVVDLRAGGISKAYARVKRWREETRLLQEENGAVSAHARIQYSAVHLHGAMALAARQAAVRRKLAHRFRRMWWRLSDRVAQPQRGSSAQSSDEEEWDDDDEGPDAEAVEPGNSEEHGVGGEDGGWGGGRGAMLDLRESSRGAAEEEEEEEGKAEDAEGHRARMDELLAIQTTSLQQYDEL